MTRDDVIRMAREAGDDVEYTLPSDLDFLERFASLVAEAERDALRLELGVARQERDNANSAADYIGVYANSLRARIEEMERQEPVAFALYSGWARKAVYLSEIEACEQRDRRQLTADLGDSLEAYRVAPLYLAPGAQAAPSIPDDVMRDAKRYRFLRAAKNIPISTEAARDPIVYDAAIDAAMLAAALEPKP